MSLFSKPTGRALDQADMPYVSPVAAARVASWRAKPSAMPFWLPKKMRATGGAPFRAFEAELSPLVSVAANFDELLTPADHVSRRPSDTFYVDDATLLRCHMTAHQTALLRGGRDCAGEFIHKISMIGIPA